ncbi:MAG: hypothetical protein U5P10_09290 [Spirochaetia bacterium]|nr:hypothetical protein [Spirochaetia bacterium]
MERKDVEGMIFPNLVAETLAGNQFQTPDPDGETSHVILIAFKRGVQAEIDEWLSALSGTVTNSSDIEMYEVPMLAGGFRLMSGIIDGGMRSGIPQEKHSSVATFYGDIKRYKEILDMEQEDQCYLYIIDPQGTIRFAATGPPSPELVDGALKALQ